MISILKFHVQYQGRRAFVMKKKMRLFPVYDVNQTMPVVYGTQRKMIGTYLYYFYIQVFKVLLWSNPR